MERESKQKDRLTRFRHWHPAEYADSHEEHECLNCGKTFVGQFCPRCGQKATAGTFTWQSVRQGVMDIWGMGTRSLPYSLWQLMWRPGHFIRDYVSGHLQSCFPPVKMLIVVAVIGAMLELFVERITTGTTADAADADGQSLLVDRFFNFMISNDQ